MIQQIHLTTEDTEDTGPCGANTEDLVWLFSTLVLPNQDHRGTVIEKTMSSVSARSARVLSVLRGYVFWLFNHFNISLEITSF